MFHASASNWSQDSPLKVLISRATYPSQPEPNYALNLEVAEYVNQKKANSPREAAMTVAGLVNHRNPHVAMLALALLDTLVQSCGYPFHLQIATKEFLNELVRRFPERPPPYPGPVMSRILELIHGWKEGICVDSRWKDDLGNIRDMHRLLTFKGYRFRDFARNAQASNTATAMASNLKTAEELENEDREAQSAKLQELIRRGTPRDLAQAQELMKTLAGANPDAKPDYRTQALTELNKLESKVILLNEMLDNVDTERGERFAQGDVYDQVASILTSARPKIQGWISNAESDDPESLDTFLQINDQLNSVLNRYEAFKKGDYAAAANPIPSELSKQQNDLSLIDFDDSAPAPGPGASGAPGGIDDLASLFASSNSSAARAPAQPAQVSQPQTINANTLQALFSSPQPANAMGYNAGAGAGSSLFMNTTSPTTTTSSLSPSNRTMITPQFTPQGTPPAAGMIRLGTPQGMAPQQQQPLGAVRLGSPTPNWGAGGGFASNGASGAFGSSQFAQPTTQQQQQQQQPPAQNNSTGANQAQGKDPFADLVGLF